VSNFTIEQLQHLISVSKTVPAVNQIEMHPYLAQAALKQYCEVCEGENVVSPCPETDPSFDLSRQARDEQHKEGKESTHQKRGEQTFVFLQGSGIRVMAYSPLGSSADRYPVRTNQLQLQLPLFRN
jgi:diketogulonate reductase-like aldo/keto reductase